MDRLAIVWEWSDGENAVWETEHMFGFDVMWGFVSEGRYVPTTIISRSRPLSNDERRAARQVLVWRQSERYDYAVTIVQDLAEVWAD